MWYLSCKSGCCCANDGCCGSVGRFACRSSWVPGALFFFFSSCLQFAAAAVINKLNHGERRCFRSYILHSL